MQINRETFLRNRELFYENREFQLQNCLFTKRLEHGVFLWPSDVEPGGTLMLNPAQLSMLIDGVDWRAPERQWRPAVAG
jgi:transposase